MPDYSSKIRALRAKAADKAVTPEESAALNAKADELEKKYRNVTSPTTEHTVTRPPLPNMADEAVLRYWEGILGDLLKNQWKWNDKYYDRHGNPRPQEADADDLYEEQFKYADPDYDEIIPRLED